MSARFRSASPMTSSSWMKNGPSPAGSVGVRVQLLAASNVTGTKLAVLALAGAVLPA